MIKLTKKHIKPSSVILARIFESDMKDIFPDQEERRRKARYVTELELRIIYSSSLIFATSSNLEGFAIWIHSDKWRKRLLLRIITSGAVFPAIKIGFKGLKKIAASNKHVEKKHMELAPYKHWYLSLLAVQKEFQGKGFASILLKDMLQRFDKEGLPCYLETDGERNIAIYKHFGFQEVDEFTIPKREEKMVAMVRQPKRLNNS